VEEKSATSQLARLRAADAAHELQALAAEDSGYGMLLRAALLLWLDTRDRLLCSLSCEDGEWPEGPDLRGMTKSMRCLMKLATMYADMVSENALTLIWALLDEQAAFHGYTVEVNWSLWLRLASEKPPACDAPAS